MHGHKLQGSSKQSVNGTSLQTFIWDTAKQIYAAEQCAKEKVDSRIFGKFEHWVCSTQNAGSKELLFQKILKT